MSEPAFIAVAKASDLAPGGMRWMAVDRERVLLVNIAGVFHALNDACSTDERALPVTLQVVAEP